MLLRNDKGNVREEVIEAIKYGTVTESQKIVKSLGGRIIAEVGKYFIDVTDSVAEKTYLIKHNKRVINEIGKMETETFARELTNNITLFGDVLNVAEGFGLDRVESIIATDKPSESEIAKPLVKLTSNGFEIPVEALNVKSSEENNSIIYEVIGIEK
ncbi:MAG: hypothetical protein N4A47_02610 [Clostridia bacterium]|jgi:hypothetical protein|nr:hypothetical protein [Clostridia bacterium]